MKTNKEDKLLTIEEVLNWLNITRYRLYCIIHKKGYPKPIKINRRNYWRVSDIQRLIEERSKNKLCKRPKESWMSSE